METHVQHTPTPQPFMRRQDDHTRPVTAEDLASLIDTMQALNQRLDMMNETMPAAMAIALTQAIKTTLEDPAFWDKSLDQFGQAVGRRGVKSAGTLTLGLLKKLTTSTLGWLVIAAFVYNVGGWALLTNFVKGWLTIKQP